MTGADGREALPRAPESSSEEHRRAGLETASAVFGRARERPSTVAYHLRKVFVKLGISSCNQLARALPELRRAAPLDSRSRSRDG